MFGRPSSSKRTDQVAHASTEDGDAIVTRREVPEGVEVHGLITVEAEVIAINEESGHVLAQFPDASQGWMPIAAVELAELPSEKRKPEMREWIDRERDFLAGFTAGLDHEDLIGALARWVGDGQYLDQEVGSRKDAEAQDLPKPGTIVVHLDYEDLFEVIGHKNEGRGRGYTVKVRDEQGSVHHFRAHRLEEYSERFGL